MGASITRTWPPTFPPETLPQLRSLDFINKANLRSAHTQEWDGACAAGNTYEFLVEVKRSYLDRSTLNAVIAHLVRSAKVEKLPLLVARYIPKTLC
jgi:hypothetical protein